MNLIDISPKIRPGIDVWPGDIEFEMHKSCNIDAGDHLDLGDIRTTLHVGAHTDAHRHYVAGGADAASMPLAAYYGPCQVIDVDVARGARFGLENLKQTPTATRILFRTGTFPNPDSWNTDFAAPSPELVDAMADRGVVLMGFDTPSTDLFDDKELVAHKRLHAGGVVNLEGLVLNDVAAAHYTLSAFPLRIEGADASPVRAVLIQD